MKKMTTADLLGLLRPPDPELFYQRGDPNDPRLGELIDLDHTADRIESAQVVIIGCPQDEGVRRNRGRIGAALAPAEIRHCLTRLGTAGLEQLRIVDLGDLQLAETLEATHARLRTVVAGMLAMGKRLIVLGGGNDISYPDCAGVADACGDTLVFNIDAHLDVRADQPCNSGTPYRQLLEQSLVRPAALYELGMQPHANAAVYVQYLRQQGATIMTADQLQLAGVETVIAAILERHDEPAIFWGLDLDVVQSAEAPGVSAPNTLGLRGAELCRIAALAGAQPRTRLLELSEVNPTYDLDQRTSRLAALAIWHFLAALAARELAG